MQNLTNCRMLFPVLHIIRPQKPLGGGAGGLIFDPDEMKGMLATGEMHAENYVASLSPGDVDWA
jgi:NTE family protein